MRFRYRLGVCVLVCVCASATNVSGLPSRQSAPAGAPAQKAPVAQTPPASASASTPSSAQQTPGAKHNTEAAAPAAQQQKKDAALVPEAWELLETAAMSDKSANRSDAILALAGLKENRAAIAMVIQAVDDKDESIRLLAVTSLGDMKVRAAIPRLHDALDDDSGQVSFAAAQALWKMGDRTGSDILYEVLAGERKVAPGVIKSKLDKAKKEMHDPKSLALIAVNETSGAFLGPFSMGISFAEEYAKDRASSVQAVCARLLADDRSERATQELQGALSDNNWVVRAAAARSLAQLGRKQAVPQLADMMHADKSQPARLTAAAAIIQLSPVQSAAYLAKKRADEKIKAKPAPAAEGSAPTPPAPTPAKPDTSKEGSASPK